MPSDRERNEKWPVDAEVAASGSQPTGHGGVGRREFLTQMGSLAAATPLGLVLLSGAAAWAVHRFRAPETVAKLFPTENPHVRTAQFWRPVCAGVQCTLCPFECFLPDGARGRCRVRMNHGGRLVTLVFGHPVSVAIDPIEKKPVFHLIPGSLIYSLATVGCNLTCKFCQNWEISQTWPEQAAETVQYPKGLLLDQARGGQVRIDVGKTRVLSPEEIVQAALRTGCKSIAYTYSEPTVFYEYVLETAKLGKEHGLKNVLVSCGYINPEPLRQLAKYFDVIKIDLKGFDEDFYRQVAGGELRFVLRTLLELKKAREQTGVLTEVVNLVVPSLNDDPKRIQAMCEWILENLGPDVPVFFSRFSPNYQLTNLPQTPVEAVTEARRIAMEMGLHYVYVGNVVGHPGENTYCPKCKRALVERYGYYVKANRLAVDMCPFCGTRIPGIWY